MPLSPLMRRAGRFALSGGIAIAFSVQILPLGLLSPVEAYTPPAGWALTFSQIVGPASATAGSTIYYTFTATYQSTNSDGSKEIILLM